MTYKDMKTIDYRKKRFMRVAEQIEEHLLGMDSSVAPYTRNEDGSYSEEKTRGLVDDLINAMIAYENYLRAGGQLVGWTPNDDTVAEQLFTASDPLVPSSTFGAGCYEVIRILLYCLLRLRDCETVFKRYFLTTAEAHTFGDLLRLLDGLIYNKANEKQLYWMEYIDYPNASVFSALDFFYDQLSDHDILPDLIPSDILAECRDAADGNDFVGVRKKLVPTDEERELFDRMTHREEFKRAYLDFRRGWFGTEFAFQDPVISRALMDTIEGGINLFLYLNGQTYIDDDNYFVAYGLMDRAEKQLRQLLTHRED